MALVERIDSRFIELKLIHDIKFNEEERRIRKLLESPGNKNFELGFAELGKHLGFVAERPEADGAPDGWWICPGKLAFVFEHHSEAKDGGKLSLTKTRQLLSHEAWLRKHAPESQALPVVSVLVSPAEEIEVDARHLLDKFSVWPLGQFTLWVETVLTAIRELRSDFPGLGDIAWRSDACTRLENVQLSPSQLHSFMDDRTGVKMFKRR